MAPPTLPRAQMGLRSPLSSSPRKGWTCQTAVYNRQPLRVVASAPLSELEWWPLPRCPHWSGGLCPSICSGVVASVPLSALAWGTQLMGQGALGGGLLSQVWAAGPRG